MKNIKWWIILIICGLMVYGITPAYTSEVNRGKTGQLPQYPDHLPLREKTQLVLLEEPTITLQENLDAIISFQTAMPCPAVRVHYGMYEPDQVIPLPRYRKSVKEKAIISHVDHEVTIPLAKLLNPVVDVNGMKENNGGIVAYRIEIYNPEWATTVFYDRRFAFKDGKQVPTITEGPVVDQVTSSSAIISWDTDFPVKGWVALDDKMYSSELDEITTHFEIFVSDLNAGTVNNYRVGISDGEFSDLSRSYFFRTADENPTSFKFAAMGDSRSSAGGGENAFGGTNLKVMRQLALEAFNKDVDFIIHTGDMINGHTTSVDDFRMQLQAYKDAIEPITHFIPIYEVMGNHEAVLDIFEDGSRAGIRFDKRGPESSESLFAEAFVNPGNAPRAAVQGAPTYRENVYWFDYGNSRFVVMNNNYWWSMEPEKYGGNLEGYVLDDQTEWLLDIFEKTTSDDTIEHLFLFAQEPMFPNSTHAKDAMWYNGGDPGKNRGIDRKYIVQRRDEIWGAFVATGKAAAAEFGDEHCYCRMLVTPEVNPDYKESVWQLISGGAGAPYYAQNKNVPWSHLVEVYSTQVHYTLINVDGSRVSLEVYSITGQLIDEAVLKE